MKRLKYRIHTTLAALSLLLCILTAAVAVRSWSVEDWMARSRWNIHQSHARQITWTLLSERGKLSLGRREITVPITGQFDPAYWQNLAEKPEYSWRAISFAARRGIGGETLMQRLGFHYLDISQEAASGMAMRYREMSLPYWFVAACLLILPGWWVILKRRQPRKPKEEQATPT
jgi:hypothetical protein